MNVSFDALPSDILIHIFKTITRDARPSIIYWTGCITLLGVCQRWRHLALPVVHRVVVLDYNERIRTNADLISSNIRHIPRTVSVWITCKKDNPVQYLQDVVEKLQANSNLLSRIALLDLSVYFSCPEITDRENYMVMREDTYNIASDIRRVLPNISTLLFRSHTSSSFSLVLETALYNEYAPQLKRAKLDTTAMLYNTNFSNLLTHLSLFQYPESNLLSKIDVINLTRLELHEIDSIFKWDIFVSKDATKANILYFPALQHMSVSVLVMPNYADNNNTSNGYDDDSVNLWIVGPNNNFGYVFEAPKLKVLEMFALCPLTLSFLASIAVPKTIDQLCVRTLNSTDLIFYQFTLSAAAKTVFVKHYNVSLEYDTIDDIVFANDLQSTSEIVYSGLNVRVEIELSTAVVENIMWPQVTRLNICSTISLTDIITLISLKLPGILILRVHNIKIDKFEDGSIGISELLNNTKIIPVKSNLRTLVYEFSTYEELPQDLCRNFEEFMFKTIKSLKYCNLDSLSKWVN